LTREAGVGIKSGAQAPGRPKLSGARIRGRKRTGLNGWDFHTFYLTPFHGLTAFLLRLLGLRTQALRFRLATQAD